MNKKITFAIVLSLLISSLTGCFPTGEYEQKGSSQVDNTTASSTSNPAAFTIPNDLTNVKFNIEISSDYPSEVPTIKVKKQIFDADEVKAMFLDGKTIVDDFSQENFRRLATAEGEHLVVERGRLTYSVDHLDDDPVKHAVFSEQNNCVTNLEYFYIDFKHLDSELEGFSRAEALAQADELIKPLNIKHLAEPRVYAFTTEDYDAIFGSASRSNLDKDGNKVDVSSFNDDAEFYLVRYYAEYDGIPISEASVQLFDRTFHSPSKVDVLISKDGLIRLDCENIFDGVEEVEQTQIKYGFEDAIKSFHNHYAVKDTVLEYTLEYNKIGLEYVMLEDDFAADEIVFKPLWQLSGTQFITSNGISLHTNAEKFLNPETGMIYNNDP